MRGNPRAETAAHSPGTCWTPPSTHEARGLCLRLLRRRGTQAHPAGDWQSLGCQGGRRRKRRRPPPGSLGRLCSLRSALRLPVDAALPRPVGPGALPGVVNPLLFLLHRREEWGKQEERWCEEKKVQFQRSVNGECLPSPNAGKCWASNSLLLPPSCRLHWEPGAGRGCSGRAWYVCLV